MFEGFRAAADFFFFFFFGKQHFITEAFTDINTGVIRAVVRNPPSLVRQTLDLV